MNSPFLQKRKISTGKKGDKSVITLTTADRDCVQARFAACSMQLSSMIRAMIRNGAVVFIMNPVREISPFLRSKMNRKSLLFIFFGRKTLLQFCRPALRKV